MTKLNPILNYFSGTNSAYFTYVEPKSVIYTVQEHKLKLYMWSWSVKSFLVCLLKRVAKILDSPGRVKDKKGGSVSLESVRNSYPSRYSLDCKSLTAIWSYNGDTVHSVHLSQIHNPPGLIAIDLSLRTLEESLATITDYSVYSVGSIASETFLDQYWWLPRRLLVSYITWNKSFIIIFRHASLLTCTTSRKKCIMYLHVDYQGGWHNRICRKVFHHRLQKTIASILCYKIAKWIVGFVLEPNGRSAALGSSKRAMQMRVNLVTVFLPVPALFKARILCQKSAQPAHCYKLPVTCTVVHLLTMHSLPHGGGVATMLSSDKIFALFWLAEVTWSNQ